MINPAALSALSKGDFDNFMVAATPGGIEAQEKVGQMALVNSTDMPKDMRPNQEAFEKVGFTFGGDVDELFVSATLPKGWKRAATNHSMHSDILDEQGRERVSIFYKAAFYDRRAHSYLEPRFIIKWIFGGEGEGSDSALTDKQMAYGVFDAGKEIFRTGAIAHDDWGADKINEETVKAWLKKDHPNYTDPTAYWDEK